MEKREEEGEGKRLAERKMLKLIGEGFGLTQTR